MPPVSTALCMPKSGFPTSTIGISIFEVVIDAIVEPPRLSLLLWNVCVATPASFASSLNTAIETASDVYAPFAAIFITGPFPMRGLFVGSA